MTRIINWATDHVLHIWFAVAIITAVLHPLGILSYADTSHAIAYECAVVWIIGMGMKYRRKARKRGIE